MLVVLCSSFSSIDSIIKLSVTTARIEVQAVVARLEAREKAAGNDGVESDANVEPPQGQQQQPGEDGNEAPEKLLPSPNYYNENNNPELLACFQRIWERGEMYKGAGPLTWTLAISNFIFFFVNAFVKGRIQRLYRGKNIPPYLALLASCLAGSMNVLITNPLWSTNLRIIANQSTHASLWKELLHVSKTLGPKYLWHGTAASLLLVSNPVIQFFCYEQIKAWRLARLRRTTRLERPNLSAVEAFVLGALAKAVATVTTYPLQLAQAVLRMQLQRGTLPSHSGDQPPDHNAAVSSKGILQCLLGIYQRDGIRGLYTGMNAKLLQTVLTAALTFLTYEQILAAVYAVHQKLLRSAPRRRDS